VCEDVSDLRACGERMRLSATESKRSLREVQGE
jgi:hypothetical protein